MSYRASGGPAFAMLAFTALPSTTLPFTVLLSMLLHLANRVIRFYVVPSLHTRTSIHAVTTTFNRLAHNHSSEGQYLLLRLILRQVILFWNLCLKLVRALRRPRRVSMLYLLMNHRVTTTPDYDTMQEGNLKGLIRYNSTAASLLFTSAKQNPNTGKL